MVWRSQYLDAFLVPLGLGLLMLYHLFFFYQVKYNPSRTIVGLNHVGRTAWVHGIMKDNDKKNILAVQTLRNSIMASTLMATTAILLSSGVAALVSNMCRLRKTGHIVGSNGGFTLMIKLALLLLSFLFSFLCYVQSIRFFNHVNYLINVPVQQQEEEEEQIVSITPEYVAHVLARGSNFYTVGTRGFYFAFPLLLWFFGSIAMFLCSILLVPVLYHLDMVHHKAHVSVK